MSHDEIKTICSNAAMIVGGYAFSKKEDSNIQIIQIYAPHHGLILSPDGEVLETSMDDVELDIVKGYWMKNHKYMEDYAEVL